jgi:hypothetical protein
VILRYQNRDEEDVCEGAVYRPQRVHNPQRKCRGCLDPAVQPTCLSAEGGLASHIRRDNSPPPAYDVHQSSLDNRSEEEEKPTDDSFKETVSAYHAAMASSDSGPSKKRRLYKAPSSDSTISEAKYQRRQRGESLSTNAEVRSKGTAAASTPRCRESSFQRQSYEEGKGIEVRGAVQEGANNQGVSEATTGSHTQASRESDAGLRQESSDSWYEPPPHMRRGGPSS